MANTVQGGRLAARAVAAHGVDAVFTLSGGHVMPIYEGCRHEGVRVLDVRHEQAAAHAAEAWGRMRRACGVAVVTAGPGVTGTLTAVANCFVAQTPLVVIGGARPLVQAGQGALQELDQLSLFAPITKWAAICGDAERMPDFVATAFRHALAPPRGPVYLELPMDILFADADDPGELRPGRAEARAFGDPDEIARAADLLSRAERPALVAGSGVWWDGAWEQLRELVDAGRLPVFLQGSARGALPPEDELVFAHARGLALEAADVVCVVGTGLDFRLRFGRLPRDTKLIQVHADASELGRNRVPDVGIVGDCAAVLGALADSVRPVSDRTDWLAQLRTAEQAWWDEHRAEIESDRGPLHHYRLGAELDAVLDPDTVVIGDGGDVVAAVSRVLRVHRPGPVARSGAVRLPRRRPAVRARREGGRAGHAGRRRRGRRRLRPERLRVRDPDPARHAGGVRDRQRRRVGRDPDPADRHLRRRRARSRRGSRRPATTGSSRPSAATASTSSGPTSSVPRSSGRSQRASPRS